MEIQELKKDKEKILYSCECCKYSSFMKRDYNVHLATKKHEKLSQGLSTRKDFFCDQCSYNSKYWSNVEKHKLSHMKRKKRAALNEIVEIERQLRLCQLKFKMKRYCISLKQKRRRAGKSIKHCFKLFKVV